MRECHQFQRHGFICLPGKEKTERRIQRSIIIAAAKIIKEELRELWKDNQV